MSTPSTPVRSFAELCAALEVSDLEGFERWLRIAHDEPEWLDCETTVDGDSLRTWMFHIGLDNVDFELKFPCTLDDVWSEVRRMEDTVMRHQGALYLNAEGFGVPEEADDDTDEVAKMLYVSADNLVEAIGGPWTAFDGPQWDSNGKHIYHWFALGEPASVLIGFGGDDVFIESVHYVDDGTREIEEWPVPITVTLLSADAQGFPLSEAQFLGRLRTGVAEAEGRLGKQVTRSSRERRRMGDHDVRMTTRNLRVAGIDLDFDVKIDGLVLGTLSVSEGGLLWRPANHQKKRGIPITWAEFAEWAASESE